GERAQKGRFREFYQCDIDIIGKDKLDPLYDAEIPAVIHAIFSQLDIGPVTINVSNRKILLGLAQAHNVSEEAQTQLLRAIDKLDKIGADAVKEQLQALSLNAALVEPLMALISQKGTQLQVLQALQNTACTHDTFQAGVAELRAMSEMLAEMHVPQDVVAINLAIARGLDYYTGTVYETFLNNAPDFGSICSGGRYENLAGHYTKSHLPGVGISIGATRLFDYLQRSQWQGLQHNIQHVLVANLSPALRADYLALATACRQWGLNTEVYLENAKLDKQLRYADKTGVPIMLLLGDDEKKNGTVVVKHLAKRTQETVLRADLGKTLAVLMGEKSLAVE
ncbi:MAG: histidine--tRNA ligase family protein, partial [Alphaproteobacteria bacterium]|nr:histidine--tRNA ligase family protein [Alphaproteobacteria bacterium]